MTNLLLKYLEGIKETISHLCGKPGAYVKNGRYILCGNYALVKLDIVGGKLTKMKKPGYILIDSADVDLLKGERFTITIRLANGETICVTSSRKDYMSFRKALEKKYGLNDKKFKRYIPINNNPLDLRRSNMKESGNKKIYIKNSSGTTGVGKMICRSKIYWIASINVNGKKMSRWFSVDKFGEKGAKDRAIECRKKLEDTIK